eukprot:GHVH01004326.1.p1 GENE.GHVH01004326.1~~GHVH01004326.1.p1  ORF type:complete len:652 (-),score=116.52 GHVH01004326.1:1414-3369(-)
MRRVDADPHDKDESEKDYNTIAVVSSLASLPDASSLVKSCAVDKHNRNTNASPRVVLLNDLFGDPITKIRPELKKKNVNRPAVVVNPTRREGRRQKRHRGRWRRSENRTTRNSNGRRSSQSDTKKMFQYFDPPGGSTFGLVDEEAVNIGEQNSISVDRSAIDTEKLTDLMAEVFVPRTKKLDGTTDGVTNVSNKDEAETRAIAEKKRIHNTYENIFDQAVEGEFARGQVIVDVSEMIRYSTSNIKQDELTAAAETWLGMEKMKDEKAKKTEETFEEKEARDLNEKVLNHKKERINNQERAKYIKKMKEIRTKIRTERKLADEADVDMYLPALLKEPWNAWKQSLAAYRTANSLSIFDEHMPFTSTEELKDNDVNVAFCYLPHSFDESSSVQARLYGQKHDQLVLFQLVPPERVPLNVKTMSKNGSNILTSAGDPRSGLYFFDKSKWTSDKIDGVTSCSLAEAVDPIANFILSYITGEPSLLNMEFCKLAETKVYQQLHKQLSAIAERNLNGIISECQRTSSSRLMINFLKLEGELNDLVCGINGRFATMSNEQEILKDNANQAREAERASLNVQKELNYRQSCEEARAKGAKLPDAERNEAITEEALEDAPYKMNPNHSHVVPSRFFMTPEKRSDVIIFVHYCQCWVKQTT